MEKTLPIFVQNLVIEYPGPKEKLRAVDGIGFEVRPGECVGFIGPNGAGKSSTIKALMGFQFPKAGEVRIFGDRAGTIASKRRMGYLPEVTLYYPFLRATELLELYGGLQEVPARELRERIPRLLDRVGLRGEAQRRLIRTYSKGMQQRLGIAQALIADPELLVFDELNSGLDPLGRHDLRQVLLELKARGTTIFFSSHELHEVQALCDRVIAIHHGRLLFDLPLPELQERAGAQSLEEYFIGLIDGQEA